MKKKVTISQKLLGSALALGLTTTLTASALTVPEIQVNADTIFSISETASSTLLISDDHKCGEGKCGEGKCGEGKCGDDHKCGEDKDGE